MPRRFKGHPQSRIIVFLSYLPPCLARVDRDLFLPPLVQDVGWIPWSVWYPTVRFHLSLYASTNHDGLRVLFTGSLSTVVAAPLPMGVENWRLCLGVSPYHGKRSALLVRASNKRSAP
jgi:hypothetical protein